MPNIKVVDMAGKEVGSMELSDKVFGADVNEAVLHSAVRAYLLNQRQGTQSMLTRTEVTGGGKKPWRQKGNGRARQGSRRAPQFVHGGVVFAAKPRSYRVTLNKKTKRVAMLSALSGKVSEGDMIVVDSIKSDDYSTKAMVSMLSAVGAKKKALVVLDSNDKVTIKSLANIPNVKTVQYNSVNVYDILNCDSFVAARGAVEKLEEVYA
ncbi:MAG: 50S ribosomal protein L4 [Firmicutes bacterium]|nr:50S ribosomal protein L4 [Bacillota bacterium]MCD7783100.1 50S ribosomal protein L4 [Bacillota bacterium]MCD7787832.1 50S ribosomal protein L4 [Bacillota bacterium]MCD8312314.1 50S ribosomal protein L4 [Bacillota bacterium]MCD8314713.1 50S ribosomal protein L4 [Bacillota bacterium]